MNNSGLGWSNVTEAIQNGTRWLEAQQTSGGSWSRGSYWFSSYGALGKQAETTAYALMALQANGYNSTQANVSRGIDYLIGSFSSWGGWGATKSTATVIESFVRLNVTMDIDVNATAYVDGTQIGSAIINATNTESTFTITSSLLTIGEHTIRINVDGTGKVSYAALLEEYAYLSNVPASLRQYVDPLAENYTIGLTVSATTITPYQNVTVNMTIENNGTEQLNTMVVEIPLPNTFNLTSNVTSFGADLAYLINASTLYIYPANISNKTSYSFNYTMSGEKPVTANFSARVSPMYNPTYFAQSDSFILQLVPETDIIVENNLTMQKGTTYYTATEPGNVTVTITNNGTASATVPVHLSLDGVLVYSGTMSIANKSSVQYNYTDWGYSAGTHTVTLSAPQVTGETDYSNNERSASFYAYLGEYGDLYFNTTSISTTGTAGSAQNVGFNVSNMGIANAGNITVRHLVAGALQNEINISSLAVNASTNVTGWAWTPSSAGTYNITLSIDPSNTVDELSDANNIYSVLVTISAVDDGGGGGGGGGSSSGGAVSAAEETDSQKTITESETLISEAETLIATNPATAETKLASAANKQTSIITSSKSDAKAVEDLDITILADLGLLAADLTDGKDLLAEAEALISQARAETNLTTRASLLKKAATKEKSALEKIPEVTKLSEARDTVVLDTVKVDTAIASATEEKAKTALERIKSKVEGVKGKVSVARALTNYKISNKEVSTAEAQRAKIVLTLSATDVLKNIEIVEVIPKSVAQNVAELLFSEMPEILQADPIVKWTVGRLVAGTTKSLSYTVKGNLTAIGSNTVVGGEIVPEAELTPEEKEALEGVTGKVIGLPPGEEEAPSRAPVEAKPVVKTTVYLLLILLVGLVATGFLIMRQDLLKTLQAKR